MLQANSRGDGDGERDIDATTMTGRGRRSSALAAAPDASRERRRSATGACLLVATAFRSPETATRATRGAFEHAGASIAGSLLALWRARLVGGARFAKTRLRVGARRGDSKRFRARFERESGGV